MNDCTARDGKRQTSRLHSSQNHLILICHKEARLLRTYSTKIIQSIPRGSESCEVECQK